MASIRCRPARIPQEAHACVSFRYHAEGGANVVFRVVEYKVGSQDEPPFVFVGPRDHLYHHKGFLFKVLRVSKGLPKTLTAEQVKSDFDHEIEPLFDTRGTPNFRHFLLDLELVLLDDEVIDWLNAEMNRHTNRPAIPIPYRFKGLLMDDMSVDPHAKPDEHTLTIELKPKWLAQSPNAPQGALRCRTCALQALRNSDPGKTGRDDYFCPLYLSPSQRSQRPYAAKVIRTYLSTKTHQISDQIGHRAVLENLVSALTRDSFGLLRYLKQKQIELDPQGVLGEEVDMHNLRLAMTLRDCSLFLRCTYSPTSPATNYRVDMKLADLDLKSPAKVDDWRSKEQELITEDWYFDKGNVGGIGDCGLKICD
ncbi:uncharacterized protein EI97DRAFT_212788 [Westerdykella ornata]|uniref:Inositol-pentakisphosphate 2-kinase n=1 Tax=Westerdykella ornata TaxID=318751 RepID=A0A6A6J730_WESOR|nr:uncharacterized protein EI97DRAFT_212788 [Westerdykella ornata]KAF2272380.1 hypothetical protein EI97DRAFT_212788 [Westerdykella ornata]